MQAADAPMATCAERAAPCVALQAARLTRWAGLTEGGARGRLPRAARARRARRARRLALHGRDARDQLHERGPLRGVARHARAGQARDCRVGVRRELQAVHLDRDREDDLRAPGHTLSTEPVGRRGVVREQPRHVRITRSCARALAAASLQSLEWQGRRGQAWAAVNCPLAWLPGRMHCHGSVCGSML